MGCPSCTQNQNGALENAHCPDCAPVECSTPQPCSSMTPIDCIVYTGAGKSCDDEEVFATGDSLLQIQEKVVDFVCEKSKTSFQKLVNTPALNTTVFNSGVPLTEALGDIVNWTLSVVSNVPTGVNVVSKTHAEMKSMEASSQFLAGQWYLITDFKTIYEQAQYNTLEVFSGAVVKTDAPVNPIMVLAIGSNKLSPVAFQPDFPEDVVMYELSYTLPVNISTPTKGRITYRKDNKGNECNWDFRNVKFLRYPNIAGEYVDTYDSGNGAAQEFTTFGVAYVNSYNNKFIVDKVSGALDPDTAAAVLDLPNIVCLGKIRDSNITGVLRNITLKSDSGIFNFTGKFRLIDVLVKSNQSIKTVSFENAYGININANGYIENTHFKNFAEDVSITTTSYILDNVFSYVSSTTYALSILKNNQIQADVNNTVSMATGEFKDNIFQSFRDNDLNGSAISFTGNNIDVFTLNSVTGSFIQNSGKKVTGNDFKRTINNELGFLFADNNIGENFGSSSSISTTPGNRIFGIFTGNTVDDNCRGNVIFNEVSNMTFGNDFNQNIIDCALTGLNLTTATHVYNNYNCKIYRNAAGQVKLSYYDQYDAEQTVLVTA